MAAGAIVVVTSMVAMGSPAMPATTPPSTVVSPQDVAANIAAAQAALAALQANAEEFAAILAGILVNAPNDPTGVQDALTTAINDEIGALEGIALAQALTLASRVAAPTCTALGTITANNPQLPYPLKYSWFGPLANAVRDVDRGVSDAIYQSYVNAFATLLAPPDLPPGTEAIAPYIALAQALLALLKVNWHSTWTPPDGSTLPVVVRDTPAFLNLPMIFDVDGKTGLDMCGLMGLDLTTGNITQSIARLPVTQFNMRVDIQSQFLGGVIAPGYQTMVPRPPNDTTYSRAPTLFNTTMGLAGTPVDTTMLQPPGAMWWQTLNLTSAIQFRYASAKAPTQYHFETSKPGGTTNGNGSKINYTGNTESNSFEYSLNIPGTLRSGVKQLPGATSFEYCTSAKGFCSAAPAAHLASETSSMHFLVSRKVDITQFTILGAGTTLPTTCPGLAALPTAVINGSRFYLGANTASTNGHAWLDTGNTVVKGCLATASTTATLPTGFTSSKRLVTWGSTGSPAAATSKTGTIVCPTGTSITGGTLGISFGLSRYLCKFPPVNTVLPTIIGQPFQASVLTVNPGTWTPGAPNAPTFTQVWQRCNSSGGSCLAIAGQTATTYTVTAADLGRRIRVVVTATNLDGTASATSAPTAVITLPPPPVNTVLPVITGTTASGSPLTASTGTWINAPTAFAYQWLICDGAGAGCVDIGGATTNTYTPTVADQGHVLKVTVTASNIGGSGTATSVGTLIPAPPVIITAPIIKNGTTPAAGQSVFEGDHLSTTDGTWQYPGTFTYQWLKCDSGGGSCAPIAGATTSTYTAAHDDIGSTIGVEVTTTNPNGSAIAAAAPTGLVLANALLPKAPGAVPDGSVASSAASDHETVYIGGLFDTVGSIIGGGGAVPATPTAASRTPSLSALASGGTVNAVVSDTAGGYFLGGSFTSVKGVACKGVAHIKNDGTLDPVYCQPTLTGEVRALDYVKRNVTIGVSVPVDLLAVGGSFTRTDGHKNLMYLDSTGFASFVSTGDPDAAVNAIANDTPAARANFFVGGEFATISGLTVKRMARVTITAPPTNGSAVTLTTSDYPGGVDCAGGGCVTPVVKAIAFSTISSLPAIVIGGVFDRVYSAAAPAVAVARRNAAAFSEATSPNQVVGSWDPSPNGAVNSIFVATSGTSSTTPLYLAGDFTALGATGGFKGLAEYGIRTALTSLSPLAWNVTPSTAAATTVGASPNTVWKPQVDNGSALSVVGDAAGVYVAGSFTSINGTVRHRLAQLSLPGAAPATLGAWDPNAGKTVRSIAKFTPASGTPSIFVGGDYLVLGGETRNNVAELTPAGALTSWAPAGTNGQVRALGFDAGTLYAGGTFTDAGGPRSNLAAFDATTGATTAWNPGANGAVNAISIAGGVTYVGGSFSTAGGAPRANLAAIDGAGAATAWDPGTDGPVNAIAVNGTDVYVGGSFANAGGAVHANVAAIDATSGAATAWNPSTNGPVYAIGVNNDTVYLGGAFTVAGVAVRSNAAGIDRATGVANGWAPEADGTVRTLLLVGSRVFAGGDFLNIGGMARSHAAQLDGATGEATGFLPEPDGVVSSSAITGAGAVGLFGAFLNLAGGVLTSGVAFYGG